MTTTDHPAATRGVSEPIGQPSLPGTGHRPDQRIHDAQVPIVGSVRASPQATACSEPICPSPAGAPSTSSDQMRTDAQQHDVAAGSDSRTGQWRVDAQGQAAGAGVDTAATRGVSNPIRPSSLPSDFPADHTRDAIHPSVVGGDQTGSGSTATICVTTSNDPSSLFDPLLGLAADVREDLQRNRIANENRLRQLTRTEVDSDGVQRGFGLDERHPDVARLAALVEKLDEVENQATLNLNRVMRHHPLGPWCKAQTGIGNGTLPARLLAIIGDPYVNTTTGEIRTVAQLRAYCGHGDPARKLVKGMSQSELFALGNPAAKMITHLIAEKVTMFDGKPDKKGNPRPRSAYRDVYDDRKATTEGRLHANECKRCGPSGHPAQPGSPWSDAHRHADALRIVGKEILRHLWCEAKRVHESTGEEISSCHA